MVTPHRYDTPFSDLPKRRILLACSALCWFLLSLFLILPTSAHAQSAGLGQVEGVIQDASGAVIPGARIVVRNVATGMKRVLRTNEAGRYRALSLSPDEYEILVEAPGFAPLKRTGIIVEVSATATINATLTVAEAAEVVTVTEAAPITEPERTGYTATISQISIENLPVNGRRWENLMLLAPTVQPDGDLGLISVRGISGLYNNYMVDGADNNRALFAGPRGGTRPTYSLSQAAIKEFQVSLSNYSAEFGRALGGTVNAVTKSGSNAFHGEAFYYVRDAAWNAQEPFSKAEGLEDLPERRQQFGFSLGGPFIRDKLFWFLNYDQQIFNFPGEVINQGNNLNDPNQTPCNIPQVSGRCDAARADLLSRLGVFPRKGHNNVALGKVDWNANSQHNISGQYNYHRWRSPNGVIQAATRTNNTLRANGFVGVRTDFGLTRWQWLPTSTIINEFSFQAGRDFELQRNNSAGPFIDLRGNLDIDDGMPSFLPRPAFPNEKRFQWLDNFSYVRGRHVLRAGFDINYIRERMINLFQGNGEFEYFSFQDYARDVPLEGIPVFDDGARTGRHWGRFFQAFDLQTGGISRIFFTTTDWNFYVQDSWKVHPHLTLNLGLRYEYTDLPQQDQSIFNCLGSPRPCTEWDSLPDDVKALTKSLNQDKNNLGPRFALAWDVGGSQKFIVRAGYGLYYGLTSNSAFARGLFENNVITRILIFLGNRHAAAPVFPNAFCEPPLGTFGLDSQCTLPPNVSGSVGLNLFSKDYVRPLIHSTQLEFEYEITPSTSVSASYLGTRGQRLPAFVDVNLPDPTDTVRFEDPAGNVLGSLPFYSGSRPISAFSRIIMSESVVNSWYHAFVLRVKRRLSAGLQFDSHLTVSKATDEAQSSTLAFLSFSNRVDPRDRSLESGRSIFDIRKKWVSHFYWDPPFDRIGKQSLRNALEGFLFSGIVTLRDGRAFGGLLNTFVPFSLRLPWGAVDRFSANGAGADFRVPWLGRNFAEGTGFATMDLRVTREFRWRESMKAVFIWEAFNLFNRTNFSGFRSTAFDGVANCTVVAGNCAPDSRVILATPRSNFLEPTAASTTLRGPREMQFAFKFVW